jgi:large subunit ribosomal protein L3
MTQIFADDGNQVPVTVVKAGPCTIVGIRKTETHGYDALQLGFEPIKKNVSKPRAGHFKKANVEPTRILQEVRLDKVEKPYEVGQSLTVELFAPGEIVDVVGVTKGRGFQGGVKRHGWLGGEASHGSMFHRAPGSIGASSFPSRVVKGMRMAGHMGSDRVTVRNLKVLRVDADNNLLLVEGAVPGGPNSIVVIRKAVAAKPIRVAERKGRLARPARRGVRRSRQDRPDSRVGGAGERSRAARHACHQEPRHGERHRQEAVAAEGHRPCPGG